ncbi:disintegrin-like halysetin [Eucyclogobius newberryi]|uniref:disintegrin-like halysetin n=1 Tax=Eucyclogobius newberryi TaxID=166745 RepID=UPI003B5B5872
MTLFSISRRLKVEGSQADGLNVVNVLLWQECTNRCCNASTCTFSEGSQCAEGECCDDCKVSPRTSECRRRQDECDLAEYCDGVSARCPEDVFNVNGQPCDSARGFCYNGQCPQRSSQCIKMYGTGAIEGRADCFEANAAGQFYGYCKRLSNYQYIACPKQDILCGKLFCQNGNERSNYGGTVTMGSCKGGYFPDYTKDYGQVETGTKCGAGKVCSQDRCLDLETAYRSTDCSAKCPGRSVCNHKGECQCEPGWLPPYCDKEDKEYSSVMVKHLSPGAIAGISVAVIVAASCIIAGVVFILKKNHGSGLPT